MMVQCSVFHLSMQSAMDTLQPLVGVQGAKPPKILNVFGSENLVLSGRCTKCQRTKCQRTKCQCTKCQRTKCQRHKMSTHKMSTTQNVNAQNVNDTKCQQHKMSTAQSPRTNSTNSPTETVSMLPKFYPNK